MIVVLFCLMKMYDLILLMNLMNLHYITLLTIQNCRSCHLGLSYELYDFKIRSFKFLICQTTSLAWELERGPKTKVEKKIGGRNTFLCIEKFF